MPMKETMMTRVVPPVSARLEGAPGTRSRDSATRSGGGARATVSSTIGFALDFYDLYIIVFVAPVIAKLFFPTQNTVLSLAGAFGVLAATLLMRPVGAVLMGSLADRRGRRYAMGVTLFGVGAVTALMGLLPTVHQIGVLAPILLLALRLVQGIFVGGVFAATLTMAIEAVPSRWRGLVSGLVGGGATAAGSVLASLSFFAATRLFPGPEFEEWGWRAMFLVGGLPVLLSLLALRYVDESPLWQRGVPQRRPLRQLLCRAHRRVLVGNIPIVFGIGCHFLLTLGFLPTYLQVVNHVPAGTVSPLLVVVNLTTLVCAPLTGYLSERFGRRRVLLVVSAANAVILPMLYWQLAGLQGVADLGLITVITIFISCLTIAAFGPLPIFLNERFPTAIRASGVALSVNVGFAVAGLVPTAVNAWSGSVQRLPMFAVGALMVASLATLIFLSLVSEPMRGLDEHGNGVPHDH